MRYLVLAGNLVAATIISCVIGAMALYFWAEQEYAKAFDEFSK